MPAGLILRKSAVRVSLVASDSDRVSNVAPISWALASHVDEGREALNFSEFDARHEGADEVVEQIKEGEMPPAYFTRFGLHATAKLSAAEKQQLVKALEAMPEFQEHGRD